jgi:hypothetical protein
MSPPYSGSKNIPEDRTLHNHSCENVGSCISLLVDNVFNRLTSRPIYGTVDIVLVEDKKNSVSLDPL